MSNVSIFETRWIDLVFEDKNKEYGAYQLRQENPKTTVKALLIATFLFSLLLTIPMTLNFFGNKTIPDSGAIPETIIISDVFYPPSKKEPEKTAALPPARKEEPNKEINKKNLVNPKIVDPDKAKADIATNEETKTNPAQGTPEGTGTIALAAGTGNGNDVDGTATSESGEGEAPTGPYVEANLDVRPTFPGGMNKFYTYVSKNFKSPEIEMEKTLKIYVSFVIEKDGSMTDIRVPKNPGYGLEKEAIRVLKSLKIKWSPGIIKGKPVRTAYNLPISIVTR